MKTLLCAIVFLSGPAALAAQDRGAGEFVETRFHRVHLRNGNFIDGNLLKQTNKEVLMRMSFGEMTIRFDQIDRVELVKMRTFKEPAIILKRPEEPKDPRKRNPQDTAPATPVTPREVEDRVMAVLKKARNAPAEEKFDIMKEILPLGTPAATLLTSALDKFPEVELMQSVTPLLMEMKDRETIALLVSKLGTNNPAAKASAISILASIGDTTVIGDILPLLQDASPRVKKAAIAALGALNSRQAIRHLAELGLNPDQEIRREALSAYLSLCKKNGEEADIAPTLTAMLDNARGDAKVEVILAISEAKKKETWPSLVPTMKDDDAQVRMLSVIALGNLGAREAEEEIVGRLSAERDKNVRNQLAEVAAKLRLTRAVGPLIDWLGDPDTQVKSSAMASLRTLTGQNFGLDTERWQVWWQNNRPK